MLKLKGLNFGWQPCHSPAEGYGCYQINYTIELLNPYSAILCNVTIACFWGGLTPFRSFSKIKLWHGFIIGLACMCCLHCTCMQLYVHKCMLSAALSAECHFLTCEGSVPLSTSYNYKCGVG